MWGVTSDGAFVPLNDVAEGITVVADDVAVAEDVVAEARTTGAAELVSKCTKLSTGG